MFATWSSIFSLGKLALGHCPPLFLTASRMLLAATLLLVYLGLKKFFSYLALKNPSSALLSYLAPRKPISFKITAIQFLGLFLYGLLGTYLANAFEFWSLQHLTAAKTCFLYSLSPFLSALFSYLHFGEKMNLRKWLGLAIGILGIVPVLVLKTGSEESLQSIFFLSWPELSMLGAVLCSAYGWTLLRLLVKDSSISPAMSNGIGMLMGGLFALGHSYLVESWNPWPVDSAHFGAFAQGTLLMTLISNILCFNLYGLMLKRFTATFLSFMGLLSPIFASFCSWAILGEAPSLLIFLSTGILSFGLWLVYSAELKQGYILRKNSSTLIA